MFRIIIAFVEHLPENIKLQVYTALLSAPLSALQYYGLRRPFVCCAVGRVLLYSLHYYSPCRTSAKPYKTTRLFVGNPANAVSKTKVCKGAAMPRGPFLQAAAGRPAF